MSKDKIVEFISNVGKEENFERAYDSVMATGWCSTESHDEYTDLNAESFYKGEYPYGESLNVSFTICWPERSFYLVFGVNKGQGMDELSCIDFIDIGNDLALELAVAVERDETGELKRICELCPEVAGDIKEKLSNLQNTLCSIRSAAA